MNIDSKDQKAMPMDYMKLELAAKKALESLLDYHKYDEDKISVAIDVLQAALAEQAECPHGVDDGACKECYMEQAEQEPEVWYCPDCGTLSELQVKCCPDWIRSRKVPNNFALTCKATFDRKEQAEQEPVAIIEKEAGFETEVYATGHADSLPDGVFKLYAAPMQQAEQEPVADVVVRPLRGDQSQPTTDIKWLQKPTTGKLYAAPAQTKDLTGQDLCDLEVAVGWKGDSHEFEAIVKAAIDKYKEKQRGT